jgi:DNA-binding HxlR family transcriptional regulator
MDHGQVAWDELHSLAAAAGGNQAGTSSATPRVQKNGGNQWSPAPLLAQLMTMNEKVDRKSDAGYCGGRSCASEISLALEALSGKWAVPVLEGLYFTGGPGRFRALQRRIGTISQKELARQLHKLMEHRIVRRSAGGEATREVTYSLTESGLQLMYQLQGLGDWTKSNRERRSSPNGARWLALIP